MYMYMYIITCINKECGKKNNHVELHAHVYVHVELHVHDIMNS